MKAWICVLAALAAACSETRPSQPAAARETVMPPSQQVPIGQLPPIDVAAVLAETKVLASDQFEGRAPGTRGETLSVNYVTEQFRKLGLKPGNPDGSYVQKVPLVGITADPAPLVFRKGREQQELKWK